MRTDEITSHLEPGRELDALVAGELFDAFTVTSPEYSTNMFHAWLVVEQLRKDGWYARLTYTSAGYRCEFSRNGERFGALVAPEPKVCRMPLAVCRAAMLVVDARSAQAASA